MEIVTILVLQAFAFAVLSAIVANNKNRDPTGWFILGLLFGVFTFLAALVVNEVEPQRKVTTTSARSTNEFDPEDEEKKCPDCAEYVRLEAHVCKHCGYRWSEDVVEQHVEQRKQEFEEEKKKRKRSSIHSQEKQAGAEMRRICSTCHTPHPLDQDECTRCGAALTD